MSIEKRFFGKLDGKGDVDIYKITNKNGAFVELMTLGAGIHSINDLTETASSATLFWALTMLIIILIPTSDIRVL